MEVIDSSGERRFPCPQCGAKLQYAPGTKEMRCGYCGNQVAIAETPSAAGTPGAADAELDFRRQLAHLENQAETAEFSHAKCDACAAEVETPPNATAFACPYCGADIVATARSKRLIKPQALLPFKIQRDAALEMFRKWLRSLWFAPSALKQFARVDHRLAGMYVPYWTYDADTTTRYTGQRGDDYWDTETYTENENGRIVTKTRQVRRTRWTYAAGVVGNSFDDLLVLGSKSLPRHLADALEPWDLKALVDYADEYLSGFRAESYQVSLAEGFETAKGIMKPKIEATVCADIGGDHQRIDTMSVSYGRITFKHVLLPLWISSYLYKSKTYRFLVNARTGEVRGERPYSWIKITLFVLGIAAAVGAVAWIWARAAGH